MKLYSILPLSALAFAAMSCGVGHKASNPVKEAPIELSQSETQMSSGINRFGFKVYGHLSLGGTRDFLLSPLSLSTDLALCAGGAGGSTSAQMYTALGLEGLSSDETGIYFNKLASGLSSVDSSTTFESANSIWAAKGLQLKPPFVNAAYQYYDALVRNVDFSSGTAAKTINDWCNDKTHGKIDKIMDHTDAATQLMLLNAVYFKAKWGFEIEADKSETVFHGISGDSSLTFLDAEDKFGYAETSSAQMVSIPYGNGSYKLVMALPKPSSSFDEMYADVSAAVAEGAFPVSARLIHLRFPEFKIETTSSLSQALAAIGMTAPFSANADFGGISDTGLQISDVLQKAFIEVNEEGTEAAAVTNIAMVMSMVPDSKPQPLQLTFDRPFLFFITEAGSSSVLFIGQKVE